MVQSLILNEWQIFSKHAFIDFRNARIMHWKIEISFMTMKLDKRLRLFLYDKQNQMIRENINNWNRHAWKS